MAQTKKRSILFVVALAVFAALIVILAATLSACSGDEDEKTEPTPTETVQPEATTEPASADAATVTGGNDAAVSGSNSTAAKQPTKSGSGSNSGSTANNGGSKDNGRDKIDYIKNYGDNVEKGVEGAADNFVGSLKDIGNAYDKGDVEGITNTVEDFSKGLGDFLGGIKDSIVP